MTVPEFAIGWFDFIDRNSLVAAQSVNFVSMGSIMVITFVCLIRHLGSLANDDVDVIVWRGRWDDS